MEITDPCVDPRLVPEGSRPIIKGHGQQDIYRPLPSIHCPDGKVITRWTPTDDERRRIAAGEDLFLCVLTFNYPLQPQLLSVGPLDYNQVECPA